MRVAKSLCAKTGLVLFLVGCTGQGGVIILPDFILVRVELPGRDALNIEVGERVSFKVAGYDRNYVRYDVTRDATDWHLTNVSGNPGTLNSNGELSATGTGSARVRASYSTYQVQGLDMAVRPAGQPKISGTVRSLSSGNPVANVTVVFYNDFNAEVGRALTNTNGSFLASVPMSTTKVNLDSARLPAGWYREWAYRAVRYSSVVENCHARVVLNQPLAPGSTSSMPDPIGLTPSTEPPPPPPNGCT